MKELLKNIFLPDNFIPHGHCYLWKPGLVWLHILSDTSIGLAYYSIPLMLLYFVHKRKDLPFQWIFWLFSAFIISCGTTHLMEIWTLWHPAYWLAGSLKVLTAIVSLYTAIELFPLIPKALALPSPAQLETANQNLAKEVTERQQAELALKQSETKFRSIFEGASIGIEIIELSGRTVAKNLALQQMLGYAENPQFDFPAYREEKSYQELKSRQCHKCHVEKGFLPWERDYYQMEKRYLCKNGQLLWCHVTGYLVRDSEGNPQFGIRMVEDITEHKQALKQLQHYQERLEDLVVERTAVLAKVNEQLTWEATHDGLTGLVNRREFEQRLETAVAGIKNQNQQHTLCYLDLDRFKIVNDTCGHAAGDELLRQVSSLLQMHVRHTDVLARLGGDEFALLLYNCQLKQGLQVAQLLQEATQSFRFVWADKTFSIGVSIGMVSINQSSAYSDGLQSMEKVLGAADAACYQAKNKGRNRIQVYKADEVETGQYQDRDLWVSRIDRALASTQTPVLGESQFCLYYQPVVPLSSESMAREYCEVLLRLIDENGEVIPPMAFLPAAERYDLMLSIDRWVISNFLSILRQRGRTNKNGLLYGINLSTASINDDQFIEFLEEQIAINQILPETLCFEITENVAIANVNKVSKLLGNLKALGCQASLDDFGRSLSSFTYLKQLPFDYLKIAGDLIKNISDDIIIYETVKSINHIAHLMGMQTIAKFVSTEAIAEKIAATGIDYAQGYGIAAPRPLITKASLIYEQSSLDRRCS